MALAVAVCPNQAKSCCLSCSLSLGVVVVVVVVVEQTIPGEIIIAGKGTHKHDKALGCRLDMRQATRARRERKFHLLLQVRGIKFQQVGWNQNS